MPVTNPSAAQMPLVVGPVTPVAPDATPGIEVTPSMPQVLSAQIPTGGTRVQKAIVTTNAAGVAAWTFPNLFAAKPVIAAIAEAAAGDQAADLVTIKITGWTQDGSSNYTGVTIGTQRQSGIAVALIGLTVQVLQGTPGIRIVHLYAAPSSA